MTDEQIDQMRAQIFWDDQDPGNEGWVFRFHDAQGIEHGYELDGDGDATTQDLAERVETLANSYASLLGATGRIRVYRGDVAKGSITLRDGEVVDWRAS